MPRPFKIRNISAIPKNRLFRPEIETEDTSVLDFVEIEALRLIDIMNMEQSEAAEYLTVSRGTLQRILSSARYKLTEAVVNGYNIVLEGGIYRIRENDGKGGEIMENSRRQGLGRGNGMGRGMGLGPNTTGRCRCNPDLPSRRYRDFSLKEEAEYLKRRLQAINEELDKK